MVSMSRTYGAAAPAESGSPLDMGPAPGQLGTGADAELAVDPGEVGLHRLRAHEGGLGDLAGGEPARRELGDALLARGEALRSGRPDVDPRELGADALGPPGGADGLEPREGGLQRGAREEL